MKTQRKYTCKVEELPLLAKVIKDQLTRDLQDFQTRFFMFDSNYITEFDQLINLLKEQDTYHLRIVLRKQQTKLVKKFEATLRDNLLILEYKVNQHPLIPLSNFPFNTLRKEMRRANTEGVLETLKEIIQAIDFYANELDSLGWKNTHTTLLVGIGTQIDFHNKKQLDLFNSTSISMDDIRKLRNQVWDTIKTITNFGKRCYHGTVKKRQYTIKYLRSLINHETPTPNPPIQNHPPSTN